MPAETTMHKNGFIYAKAFASKWHGSQLRKYTGEPYITHCVEVAALVRNFLNITDDHPTTVAAMLHDVIEDTNATFNDIEFEFGAQVAEMVFWLTDVKSECGNRRIRSRLNNIRLSRSPYHVKVIKLCDIISNCSSIVEHDPKFATTYLKEKQDFLDLIHDTMNEHAAFITAHKIIMDGLSSTFEV